MSNISIACWEGLRKASENTSISPSNSLSRTAGQARSTGVAYVQQRSLSSFNAKRRGFVRKAPATAIRVMLRHLISRGEVSGGLEAAVPMVRQWKHAALPRHLSEAEIARVLEFCANGTPLGRRNYAILLVLARLGLRANEVAQLALDEFDWVEGHAAIRGGKTRHELRLPLPNDIE